MIKLIIFDCYGLVMNKGYSNTSRALAKRYGGHWQNYQKIMYDIYVNKTVVRKITQKEAWQRTVSDLNLPIAWQELRKLHYNLMKIDKRVVKINKELSKKGYKIYYYQKTPAVSLPMFLNGLV